MFSGVFWGEGGVIVFFAIYKSTLQFILHQTESLISNNSNADDNSDEHLCYRASYLQIRSASQWQLRH